MFSKHFRNRLRHQPLRVVIMITYHVEQQGMVTGGRLHTCMQAFTLGEGPDPLPHTGDLLAISCVLVMIPEDLL